MGRDAQLCCKTCKKNYYLGYGSYRSIIFAETLDKYKEISDGDERKDFYVNLNTEKVLTEHKGHELFQHSDDWCYEKDGDLLIDCGWNPPELLAEGYADYEQINLKKELTVNP